MFNLSDRISNGRIKADPGSGFRSNTADFGVSIGPDDRGGTGAQSHDGSQPFGGNVHSSAGFRRALMKSERTAGRLSGAIANKTDFSSGKARKPNYFAQGGRRHGLHMGSGAPATTPAMDTGADAGGN